MKIGFAITSSFCTIKNILKQIDLLIEEGYEVIPIVSPNIIEWDTKFGSGEVYKKIIEERTKHKVVSTIVEAEKFGSDNPLDILLVVPATGNYIAKLANAITDETVLMATKATLRNGKPVVIGISTNDGLGLNLKNIGTLLNTKNIYFIPFGQDNYKSKPNSLVAHYDLTLPTLESALEQKQFQPVLQKH